MASVCVWKVAGDGGGTGVEGDVRVELEVKEEVEQETNAVDGVVDDGVGGGGGDGGGGNAGVGGGCTRAGDCRSSEGSVQATGSERAKCAGCADCCSISGGDRSGVSPADNDEGWATGDKRPSAPRFDGLDGSTRGGGQEDGGTTATGRFLMDRLSGSLLALGVMASISRGGECTLPSLFLCVLCDVVLVIKVA